MVPTIEGFYWVNYGTGHHKLEEIVEVRNAADEESDESDESDESELLVRVVGDFDVEDVSIPQFMKDYNVTFLAGPLVPPSKDLRRPEPVDPRGPEEYVATLPSDEGPLGEAPILELMFNWDWFITISNPADRTRLPQSIQVCTSGSRHPDLPIVFALLYAMLHGKRERALSAAEAIVGICKDESARSWR